MNLWSVNVIEGHTGGQTDGQMDVPDHNNTLQPDEAVLQIL